MVEFYSENDFKLLQKEEISKWISTVISRQNFKEGDIAFIFCSDDYLHGINVEFLDHDTLTDIVTFDYSLGKQLDGEIYISTDRVKENAKEFDVEFSDELHRVLIHGVLHLCGYKDKSAEETEVMRKMENDCLKQRSFS